MERQLSQMKLCPLRQIQYLPNSYGSSSKYKGLLNYKGEIILPNIYDGIYLFAYNRLLIEKNGKFGVIDTDGKVLAEPKYDQIVDAWEYTIGVVNIENITPEADYESPYEDHINSNEYTDPLDAYDGDSDARWKRTNLYSLNHYLI
ncbi:WG repeat-containing protein [Bacteroides acidifaciens]|uniref:WG repeat-containing protein n=1 Tax=Bacteroides acidifaciens TaxID=85831 RepID=UPI00272C8025|nr:WG repeat-containing protein [Bacteroides acidifaciens]